MLKIETTSQFIRLLDEIRFENLELETEIHKRIRWFKKNPDDTRLDNHSLTKRMVGQ